MRNQRNNDEVDAKIADILDKYGEDFNTATWKVQGTTVIYHKALERIAFRAGITFDSPQLIRAEADEAVLVVTGKLGERKEWSIGEAKCVRMIDSGRTNNYGKPIKAPADPNAFGNYIVSGAQGSYPYAMAEKRGKDRVILKLIELSGDLYSEEEADDFKRNGAEPAPQPQTAPKAQEPKAEIDQRLAWFKNNIDKRKRWEEIDDFMADSYTATKLNELTDEEFDRVSAYAKKVMKNLGYEEPAEEVSQDTNQDQDAAFNEFNKALEHVTGFEGDVSLCTTPEQVEETWVKHDLMSSLQQEPELQERALKAYQEALSRVSMQTTTEASEPKQRSTRPRRSKSSNAQEATQTT